MARHSVLPYLPENEWRPIFQYEPQPPHPAPSLPTIDCAQTQAPTPLLLHLPTCPTWDHMMHSASMMHQSVKHSLVPRETLQHCHGVIDVHIGGFGPQVPALHPRRDIQIATPSISVSVLHSLPSSHSRDAHPLPPPSATLPYTQHPLMSPGCDKTPSPVPNLSQPWP